jgi:O-succinylbenzoic acid--CoA ligase
VLRTHPAVADVGVVGLPDPDLGERVGAVVVASEPVGSEALVDYCAGALATFKVPEYLEFTDELPVSVLGKLDRKALRALLADATPVTRSAP